jgi:hypothetical protein
MALSIKRIADGEDVWGKFRVVYKDIVLDNSYPAGGYTINASDVGLKTLYEGVEVGGNAASGGVLVLIDQSSGLGTTSMDGVALTSLKLRVFFPTGGATAAPNTLANAKVTSGASTASAVNATTPDITPGIAVEVATGANLSTVTVRVRFVGR